MIKIFVSQSILDQKWVSLKVETVSYLAQFFDTGYASSPVWEKRFFQKNCVHDTFSKQKDKQTFGNINNFLGWKLIAMCSAFLY